MTRSPFPLAVVGGCALLLGLGASFLMAGARAQSSAATTTPTIAVIETATNASLPVIPRLRTVADLPPLPEPPPTTQATTTRATTTQPTTTPAPTTTTPPSGDAGPQHGVSE